MTNTPTTYRTGVWLVGARGSVATTAIMGAAGVRDRITPTTGCVTESPDFAAATLPAFGDLVFGGHDIAETSLPKRAEQLAHAGVVPRQLPDLVHTDLTAADAEIRPGTPAIEADRSQRETAAILTEDLRSFRERHDLARVVVINVSSTEPRPEPRDEHAELAALERALDNTTLRGQSVLPPSSLYAYAALQAGCSYVDFTPSLGARLPALDELARKQRLPYAGSDGKTGETLVKSALLPMFASRRLDVLAWSGTNLLGGGDGENLADPTTVTSKTTSKQRAIGESLGYPVDGNVHIDYVPELGEWKTAWDHILFEGFLGARMSLQFTWQGCDSSLAAPLILDLARLLARAHETGHAGPLEKLAFFFKDPLGVDEHRLIPQYEMLRDFAGSLGRTQ
ncbi:myo-inositol-1-phosphate synthase [Halopolyspora algeriensis]|uniref:Myo-inositol-1-phosphate synthase n=1 Tax=Halopolyspora algeriensis TaxID=1500506 RepID=A0A368W1A4_9ACTN|nr:inositol-3-phosphate synthase [Halopolyspora algeriensis]RCW45778.1 myo-inositol-1-phosphate synthase [Halopolyspora algeriensis]TQM54162.1 myo-inositol-1-phosphate synthase [Halopolyspora algeriensis]